MSKPLTADNLVKRYHQGNQVIDVLRGASLEVAVGERVAVIGRSGSGKSTLLHVLAGLDDVDSGRVCIAGEDITAADVNGRAQIRAQHMGFVYQNHHLLPEFTAVENVAMPLRIAGMSAVRAIAQAEELLAEVGLSERTSHVPRTLSGGERQRVAVARALAGQPAVVLADEPTGNLDRENAEQVIELVAALSRSHRTAFVVVTHDPSMLTYFDRVLALEDGCLQAR